MSTGSLGLRHLDYPLTDRDAAVLERLEALPLPARAPRVAEGDQVRVLFRGPAKPGAHRESIGASATVRRVRGALVLDVEVADRPAVRAMLARIAGGGEPEPPEHTGATELMERSELGGARDLEATEVSAGRALAPQRVRVNVSHPTPPQGTPAPRKVRGSDPTEIAPRGTLDAGGAAPRLPRPAPLIGRTLQGKYLLESNIGLGAMGAVFRARHLKLDKPVAVKVMQIDATSHPSFARRFEREATSASRLDDPNCVRVLDFGEEPDGLLYMVMELVEGEDLAAVVGRGRVEPARAVALMSQVLSGLARAHEAAIVHRDLKPGNVLVVRELREDDHGESQEVEIAKVCDFGMAKLGDEPRGPARRSGVSRLTEVGAIVGTPEYMAPEQARGDPVDSRADIYSAGVMLYELLTGTLPFPGDTPIRVILSHAHDAVELPSARVPGLDRRFDAVCLKAMAKDPAERYATARDMRRELRAVLGLLRPSFVEINVPPAPAPANPPWPEPQAGSPTLAALSPPISSAPAGLRVPPAVGSGPAVSPGSGGAVPSSPRSSAGRGLAPSVPAVPLGPRPMSEPPAGGTSRLQAVVVLVLVVMIAALVAVVALLARG